MLRKIKQKIKSFFSDFYNVYLALLSALVALPIIAPILLAIGLSGPAKLIYFTYSFFCHQFASRSINIFDYQIAWCARDTGIWLGVLIASFLVKYNKLSKLKWYWVIPFVVPIALDGGLQTIFTFLNITPLGDLSGLPLYVSNNLSRFMSGAIFGIGIGWWISYQIKYGLSNEPSALSLEPSEKEESSYAKASEDKSDKWQVTSDKLKSSAFMQAGFLTFVMFIVYVGLVGIWNVTSVNNKPSDWLDFTVKTPTKNFFSRRGNAICPTENAQDLLAIDCFFK
jgi:uncharacterized membrane protein